MKTKFFLLSILLVVIISNTPFIGTEILRKIDDNYFKYSNADASFTKIEKIDIYQPWINKWTIYSFIERNKPKLTNMEVYRLYTINLLCFWRWRYYWVTSRHFEYKSWEEIEPNRIPYNPDNMWQDF